jgi:predicted Fe-Mo cluster-binding NifX family protein
MGRGDIKKHQLIRQFLTEVQWGPLDYLVIDAPPGTGDEPMSVAQTIPEAHALIVTTPQEISLADVRKSINFCQKINLDMLGLVENMSGYRCPHCGEAVPLFKSGGAEKTAQKAKVPYLGALPFDPKVVEAADKGELIQLPEAESPFFQALRPIVDYLLEVLSPTASRREPGVCKFALPVYDGKLAAKFSQAKQFALFTVKDGAIVDQETIPTPAHEPGGMPEILEDLGVTHVIAAGLGEKAQGLIQHKGIEVFPGNPKENPETLVQNYLKDHPAPVRQCAAP